MAWSPRFKESVQLAHLFHVAAITWLLLFVLQVYFPDLPLLDRLFPAPLAPFTSEGHYEECIWNWQTKNVSVMAFISAIILIFLLMSYPTYFIFRLSGCFSPYQNYNALLIFQAVHGFLWSFIIFFYLIFAAIFGAVESKNTHLFLWPSSVISNVVRKRWNQWDANQVT